jgi:hypothetical protein
MVITLVAAMLASTPVSTGPAKPACRAALMESLGTATPRESGPVTPLDIATLRDFGPQEASVGGEPPFSLSPDGTHAALVLRRGDPASDAYCLGVIVVPLAGQAPPRLIDAGGEPKRRHKPCGQASNGYARTAPFELWRCPQAGSGSSRRSGSPDPPPTAASHGDPTEQ